MGPRTIAEQSDRLEARGWRLAGKERVGVVRWLRVWKGYCAGAGKRVQVVVCPTGEGAVRVEELDIFVADEENGDEASDEELDDE